MALSLDDILQRSGGDPAIKNTLESVLGRPWPPSQPTAQQLQSVPEHVPYYLQADPNQVTERDQNPVPPPLRANPGAAPAAPAPDATADDANSSDDDDSKDTPARNVASKAPAKAADDDDEDEDDDAASDTVGDKEKPTLNFGNSDGPSDADKLDAALAARKNALADAQIQHGAEQLGAGIARINPDHATSDQMQKQAGTALDEFQARQQNELNDPGSGASSGMRDYLRKLGVNVSDGATAAQMQRVMPYVFKDMEAKQAQAAKSADQKERLAERGEEAKYRNEALKLQKQALAQSKDQARQDRMDKNDTDRLDKMSKAITAETASSRSAFGRAAGNLQSIQNAKALLNGETNPDQLDNRQVYEANKVLDRVLSQGNPSIAGTAHLSPETARGDFAKMMEYWTNKRQGAGAGDFLNTMGHTLDREEAMANKQIASTQNSQLSSFRDLQKRHPDAFNQVLRDHHLPIAGESQSNPLDAGPLVNPRDQAALSTIKKNNPGISDADAQQALMKYKQSKGHQ